jgi:hypothetical protein
MTLDIGSGTSGGGGVTLASAPSNKPTSIVTEQLGGPVARSARLQGPLIGKFAKMLAVLPVLKSIRNVESPEEKVISAVPKSWDSPGSGGAVSLSQVITAVSMSASEVDWYENASVAGGGGSGVKNGGEPAFTWPVKKSIAPKCAVPVSAWYVAAPSKPALDTDTSNVLPA